MAKKSFRDRGERVQVSILLSTKANDRLNEIAEQLNAFKYDIVEMLAVISDMDDPYIRELLDKHFEEMPPSVQRAIAWTRRLEKKDV